MTVVADQADVIAFLRAALTRESRPPRLVRTHASLVFLGEARVYKLKRAVRFPFLDFSTAARRLDLCRAEVALNRRTAPALYLGARAITRGENGLEFDGDGELVDAVVEMIRFPDDALLDLRVRRGEATPALLASLARNLAAFHAATPPDRARGGAQAMARVVALDDAALAAVGLFALEERRSLRAALDAALARLSPLLDARRAAGKVRRCHGDLTLKNICVLDGQPTPFDCLEFDDDLAAIDVLYDLAFPAMDLWRRGAADLANLLVNRYLDAADESDGLPALPFFVAMRATIRAHVVAAQAQEAAQAQDATDDATDDATALRAEARAYFDLARRCLAPATARLVAVGGFSGSGKSTAAGWIAPALAPIPGARILSSDRIRKAMHGVAPETRLPHLAYAPEVSRRVYEIQRAEARAALAAGCPVVVDAVFDRPDSRAEIEAVARATGVAFEGLWLDAPPPALEARVAARTGDPSDATPAVLRAQVAAGAGEIGWTRLDASSPRPALRAAILRALELSPLDPTPDAPIS